jgi:CubicO group peptidase (beta-lactamase class C family)
LERRIQMPRTVDQAPIHGTVASGFEEVETEFKKNFLVRGELGAACAIYHRGEKVVDLWGGYRDRKTGDPWKNETLVLVFSTTKGISALTVAVAHSQGLLDYDEKVAAYWPEFAQAGKENVTVRELLAHQAGLCAIDEPLSPEVLADLDRLAAVLARQSPAWRPGTKHGYHYLSLGSYENELIRRVDPQHRSLGRFFQEEIAAPLGLEFYIGLPPEVSDSKIAPIEAFSALQMLLHINTLPPGMLLGYINPLSLTHRTLNNPKLGSPGDLDRPEYRAVELPSAGGIGQVRAIAKAYGIFAAGGSELDIGRETLEELAAPAIPPPAGVHDEVMKVNMSYSLGFFKPSPAFRFGSSVKAFGTMGAGGSFGFADPDAQVGFAYAPNKMGFYMWNDPREQALRDALGRCLERR